MASQGTRNFVKGTPPLSVNASTTAVELLPANRNRRGLWIKNVGIMDVFLGFGNDAEADRGIVLEKGQEMRMNGQVLCLDRISVITKVGPATPVLCQEFTNWN